MVEIDPGKYLPDRLLHVMPLIRTAKIACQGAYTVVVLNDKEVGVTKCNPVDKYSVHTGVRIALARAARKLLWSSSAGGRV